MMMMFYFLTMASLAGKKWSDGNKGASCRGATGGVVLHLPRKTFTKLKPFHCLKLYICFIPSSFTCFPSNLSLLIWWWVIFSEFSLLKKQPSICTIYPILTNTHLKSTHHTLAPMQVPKKRPLNKALSMMDLDATIEDHRDCGRAPPCKRPRHTDQVLQDLASPDIVGDQTVPCQTYKHQKWYLWIRTDLSNPKW